MFCLYPKALLGSNEVTVRRLSWRDCEALLSSKVVENFQIVYVSKPKLWFKIFEVFCRFALGKEVVVMLRRPHLYWRWMLLFCLTQDFP